VTVLIFIAYVVWGYDDEGKPVSVRHVTNVDSGNAYSKDIEDQCKTLFKEDHPGGRIVSFGWSQEYDVEVGR
jgi:hypothetical protein